MARLGFGGSQLEMRVDQLDPGRRVAWTCLSDFPMPPGHWRGTTVTWDLTRGEDGDADVLRQHDNWPDRLTQAELASTASTWGSQKVSSLVRYISMAVDSSARACSRCPVAA